MITLHEAFLRKAAAAARTAGYLFPDYRKLLLHHHRQRRTRQRDDKLNATGL